jgi:hypothetical protein
MDVQDAMTMYYKLKKKYEYEYLDKITKMKKNNNKDIKSWKPPCIECERPVGTLFKREFNDKSQKVTLCSTCGDDKNPCRLNIEIQINDCYMLNENIELFTHLLNEEKKEIINLKNQYLFGYLTLEDVLDKFNKQKTEWSDIQYLLNDDLEKWISKIDDEKKKEQMKINNTKLHIYIQKMKSSLPQEAVTLYLHDVLPLVDEINHLQYANQYMKFNKLDNTYQFIQEPFTLQDMEICILPPKINSFLYKHFDYVSS